MGERRTRPLSDAMLRGLRAAAADRLGRFPLETPVATTNSLRGAGLAVGRDACGHRVGGGHRHAPVDSFITPAGMCRQCGRGLQYDESGRCVRDEYGEYRCLAAKHRESATHVLWE